MIARYVINTDGSITCRCCGWTSHNPGDRDNFYCANCKTFHRDVLTVWVLYDHPSDLPGSYVVRGQDCLPDGTVVHHKTAFEFHSIAAARIELESTGLTKFERHASDDPCIVESWV